MPFREYPLAEVLADPGVEIVFHAGRQDVAILRRCLVLVPPIAEEMTLWPGCSRLGSLPPLPPAPPATRFITTPRAEALVAWWLAPT